GIVGVEAVPRPAPAAGAAAAEHRTPVEDDEVTGSHGVDSLAYGFYHPGGLMSEQERKVVVDRALPVVEIRVAHTAGLHHDQRLTRTGVWHQHGFHRDRRSFGVRYYSPDLMTHRDLPRCSITSILSRLR